MNGICKDELVVCLTDFCPFSFQQMADCHKQGSKQGSNTGKRNQPIASSGSSMANKKERIDLSRMKIFVSHA